MRTRTLAVALLLLAPVAGCLRADDAVEPTARVDAPSTGAPSALGSVSVRIDPTAAQVVAGGAAALSVVVRNDGGAPVRVALEARAPAMDWRATLAETLVPVEPGTVSVVPLDVRAPEHLPLEGGVATVRVVARIGSLVLEAASDVTWLAAGALPAEAAPPKARVVVALLDSGLNPYHQEFRRPGATAHPSTYLAGYPADTDALNLAFDAADWESAVARDETRWNSTESGRLYWVPGTNVVGLVAFAGTGARYDEGGHGTGTASIATGRTLGACPDCLVVAVQGDLLAGYRWAAAQPWIDVVSVSLGVIGNIYFPVTTVNSTHGGALAGQAWFTGAGNGWWVGADGVPAGRSVPTPTQFSPLTGSSWTLRVGSFDTAKRQTTAYTSQPVDVVTASMKTAASFDSFDATNEFGHTSGATPEAAGLFARMLLGARQAMGDMDGGVANGVAATGAPVPGGALEDGLLTREEALRVFLHAAKTVALEDAGADPADPTITPAPRGTEYWSQGYGLANATTAELALAVLLGIAAEPDRADADRAHMVDMASRDAFWGAHEAAGLYLDRTPAPV
ncbi:MAG TPA: S8/S53 family peptidase [Candidatus Thermoplasmatota archaeon]|nr:S8/S53 family peptidase [Candidatus Thermoplasmatota archaeon]